MSHFWTVRFLKTESEQILVFRTSLEITQSSFRQTDGRRMPEGVVRLETRLAITLVVWNKLLIYRHSASVHRLSLTVSLQTNLLAQTRTPLGTLVTSAEVEVMQSMLSVCRVSTTPGNPGNLLEFKWSSWKFLCNDRKFYFMVNGFTT